MTRIEVEFISLTRIGPWAVWAWVKSIHLVHFDSFFILKFLMTIYYFLIIKIIS